MRGFLAVCLLSLVVLATIACTQPESTSPATSEPESRPTSVPTVISPTVTSVPTATPSPVPTATPLPPLGFLEEFRGSDVVMYQVANEVYGPGSPQKAIIQRFAQFQEVDPILDGLSSPGKQSTLRDAFRDYLVEGPPSGAALGAILNRALDEATAGKPGISNPAVGNLGSPFYQQLQGLFSTPGQIIPTVDPRIFDTLPYRPNLEDYVRFVFNNLEPEYYGQTGHQASQRYVENIKQDYWQYRAVYFAQECLEDRKMTVESFYSFLSITLARATTEGSPVIGEAARNLVPRLRSAVEDQTSKGPVGRSQCIRIYMFPNTVEEAMLVSDLVLTTFVGRLADRFKQGYFYYAKSNPSKWLNPDKRKPMLPWVCAIGYCLE